MTYIEKIKNRLPSMALPFISILLITYFAVHLTQGTRGINVYFSLQKQKNLYQEELMQLQNRLETEESKIALLNPKHIDPDLLDEEIRYKLGLAHKDEKIVLMGLPEKQLGDTKRTIIIVPPHQKAEN